MSIKLKVSIHCHISSVELTDLIVILHMLLYPWQIYSRIITYYMCYFLKKIETFSLIAITTAVAIIVIVFHIKQNGKFRY
jgi:hypothetical protein